MVVVGTIYDKSLKEKVFYIREVDKYTHSTSTSLNVEWNDGVFTLTAVVENIVGKGYVKFYKDGEEIGEQYVSKTATLIYPSDDADAVFVARFMGNSDCLKSESPQVTSGLTTTVLTVSNNSTTSSTIGDTVTVTCVLQASDGTNISGATISDGSTTKTTDSNGKATFSYVNSNAGVMSKTYVYNGNDDYTSSTGLTNWTVNKLGTVLTVSSERTTYTEGSSFSVTATLQDVKGNVLIGKTVNLGDIDYTTNSNGTVTLKSQGLQAGAYVFVGTFDGDDDYSDSSNGITINVVDKNVPVLSVTNNSSCYVDETITVTCTLKSTSSAIISGTPISGATISDGTTTATTNSKGVCTFTYTSSTIGTVSKTYTYAGDSEHVSTTQTCSWNVVKYNTVLTVTSDKSNYYAGSTATVTATLKTSTGTAISGASVVIDGTSVTTNSSGVASKTFPCSSSGSFTKTVSYAGSGKYNSCSGSVTYTVDEKIETKMMIGSVSTQYVGETCTVKVGLLDAESYTPVSGATISDGSTTSTTDDSGVVSFSYINSVKGTVSKTFTFSGDSTYASASATVSWTVLSSATTITFIAPETELPNESIAYVTVTVADSSGNLVTTGEVQAIYASSEYVLMTDEVDSNGQAFFGFIGQDGTRSYKFKYVGNDSYGESTSDSVTFKWSDSYAKFVLSSDNLIGETGDNLSLDLVSNIFPQSNSSKSVSLVDRDTGTVYATSYINTSGKATLNYPCTGLGDRNVVAQYINGSNISESNILQIEDCIIYDPMTSDTGKWILNNNPIINYNENGCTISKTTNGEAQYILNSSIPIPVVIEFTHVTGSGRSSLGCQFDKGFVLHWDDGSNNLYQIYRFLSSTSTSTSFISKTESIGSNDKLKIIIHDNTMELWKNGAVLLSSPSYQWETTSGFWFYTNWNRSQTVKDLKIKPYSEE